MIVAGVVIAAVITPGKAGLVVFGSQLPLDRGEEFLEVPPVLAESPRSYVGDDLELGPGVRARAAGAGRGETAATSSLKPKTRILRTARTSLSPACATAHRGRLCTASSVMRTSFFASTG